MCGIFGAILSRGACGAGSFGAFLDFLFDSLVMLDYRGYDSSGVHVAAPQGDGFLARGAMSVVDLREAVAADTALRDRGELPDGFALGISHTRWATHGAPSVANSHPVPSLSGAFLTVHNGMLANCDELRAGLRERGFPFKGETDTEVLSNLFLDELLHAGCSTQPDLFPALVASALRRVRGTYAILVCSKFFPGQIVAARMRSPLIFASLAAPYDLPVQPAPRVAPSGGVSFSETPLRAAELSPRSQPEMRSAPISAQPRSAPTAAAGCSGFLFSSDVSTFTSECAIHVMNDGDLLWANGARATAYRLKDDATAQPGGLKLTPFSPVHMTFSRCGYKHFMLKEIHEQPQIFAGTATKLWRRTKGSEEFVGFAKPLDLRGIPPRLILIGCGSSFHAAHACIPIFEDALGAAPVSAEISSVLTTRRPMISAETLVVALSQSGETAETLEAMRYAKTFGAHVLAVTNVDHSTITRVADNHVTINAGNEVAVASTKTYTAQMLALIGIAGELQKQFGAHAAAATPFTAAALTAASTLLIGSLELIEDKCRRAGRVLSQASSALLLGQGVGYSLCLEGALKMKEISYLHAEAICCTELKHGTLALIDEDMPLIWVAMHENDHVRRLVEYGIKQVRSRRHFSENCIFICCSTDEETKRAASGANCIVIELPDAGSRTLNAIISSIPLQLISYYCGVEKGLPIDKPRNLAKCVTV
eukprot:gnl/Chilomastix_cuspidata/4347.p1 GENE.gnl/Chilomastix_cuspidata/4347~~gnl/Chilomastix_cuspidata/4347.p1  ORF type:complete len:709 (+),score=193.12 gnl/Chilomastix_cuspidata/4347:321-2447(+)